MLNTFILKFHVYLKFNMFKYIYDINFSSEDNFVEIINNYDDNIDDNGWITPGNIEKIKEQMVIDDEIRLEDANIKCACLTTDFAMQVFN